MKKAFDQTVRDIKRGVNKNVLKVPRIERKVLDATSNESWGPHGSLLAEIAQASRNHYEYQMIMAIIWKRLNDTGKNWRHVYKGLTVLEYLVANGSERVIGEIRARAYQISILSEFQYHDSKGRDQGINVRRKAQSLIAIVNDEEKIMEVREKSSANMDKYNSSSTGRPDSYSGNDGGYGDRYDDRNEDHFHRQDDNRLGYGRGEDRYRDEDQYGKEQDRCSGVDRNGYGPENKNADERGKHSFNEDDRDGEGKVDRSSQDERSLDGKQSDQHAGPPPGYEEAAKNADNSISDEGMDRGTSAIPVQSNTKPSASNSATTNAPMLLIDEETDAFDDFDPRCSVPAAPTVANNVEMDLFGSATPAIANSMEMDLFGSLSMNDSRNSLALVPAAAISTTLEPQIPQKSELSSVFNQANTNPFEDAPFHAIPQENPMFSLQNNIPSASFHHNPVFVSSSNTQPSVFGIVEASLGHEFGVSVHSIPSNSSILNGQPTSTAMGFQTMETPDTQTGYDILEGILPTNGPSSTFHTQNTVVVPSTRTHTDPSNFLAEPAVFMPVASQEIPPNPWGQSENLPRVTSESNLNPAATQKPSSAFPPHVALPGSPTRAQTDHSEFLAQPVVSLPVTAPLESLSNPYGQPEKLTQGTSENSLNSSSPTNELSSAFPPQAALSVTPTSDIFTLPAISMPAASEEILLNPGGQPKKLPQVTSENNLSSSALSNESSNTFLAQTALSVEPTRTQTSHSDFPFLSTASVPVSSPATLPQNYSQPVTPAELAPQEKNGASSPLPLQAALTAPPIMTQVGHSDFLAPPSLPAASKAPQPNYHGRQEISPLPGPVLDLNSSASSSKVAPTGGLAILGLSSQTSSPSFGPPITSQAAPSNNSGPTTKPSLPSDKFETKSTVWADTISRGIVNLNISGPKVNPLADIGVDFDSLNRKEKREKEKSSATPVSAVTMGKAMGSGSGMGRAAATGLAPPPNPMMGSGMGWGVGAGTGMGGFGGMNMGMGAGMGMSMSMGMGQGLAVQPNAGTPSNPAGVSVPGTGYNPLMSMNRYGSLPYGGAYR